VQQQSAQQLLNVDNKVKSAHNAEYFRYIFSEGVISQSLAVGTSLVLGLLIKKKVVFILSKFC